MERIKPLIAQGADINARNSDKETIFQATSDCYPKMDYGVVRYLVNEAGADINAHDDEYVTSLYSLALSEDLERLKLFLELGANPNTITPETFETVLDDLAVNMFYPTFLVSKYGQMKVEDLTSDPVVLKAFEELERLKKQYEDIDDDKEQLAFYKGIVGNHVRKINGLLEGLDVLEGVEVLG
jgi:hypothetical protein